MREKLYFRIGEVAKKFDVNPSLIRYWESEFDFITPRKTAKGTRMFTREDMKHFEIVYYLIKEKGLTIQGAKDYFKKNYDKTSLKKLEAINTMKRVKNMLEEIKVILEDTKH
ncbi:MAG: MerR family transcriptional regulator [Bacteroidales bacterium]|nr:MerR family transcriptional regulator [Bacteroidales bacterium]